MIPGLVHLLVRFYKTVCWERSKIFFETAISWQQDDAGNGGKQKRIIAAPL